MIWIGFLIFFAVTLGFFVFAVTRLKLPCFSGIVIGGLGLLMVTSLVVSETILGSNSLQSVVLLRGNLAPGAPAKLGIGMAMVTAGVIAAVFGER